MSPIFDWPTNPNLQQCTIELIVSEVSLATLIFHDEFILVTRFIP
jgi:hypothetical protein